MIVAEAVTSAMRPSAGGNRMLPDYLSPFGCYTRSSTSFIFCRSRASSEHAVSVVEVEGRGRGKGRNEALNLDHLHLAQNGGREEGSARDPLSIDATKREGG